MRQKYKGEDIKARLHNTIIRYKDEPYLADVDSAGTIGLNDLASGTCIGRVSADDELLDISSISIGYVNIIHPDYKLAVYLKREPYRKFKQGIEFPSLTQKALRDNISGVSHHILHSKQFVDAVHGKFPSYKDAFDLLTKKSFHSVAVSRDIALKKERDVLKVYLKDTEVGFIRLTGDHNKVYVPKSEQSYYYILLLDGIKDWTIIEGVK